MSDSPTLDERYFVWLYSELADETDRDPTDSHWLLCERLHKIEFEWSVRNDQNRALDGLELRDEFHDSTGEPYLADWDQMGCSMFEVMIALSRRASFQTGGAPSSWFWQMLSNLELKKYNDSVFHAAIGDAVEHMMRVIIRRDYEPSGRGGFFPLRDPERDQREVEMWYQLSAYLMENYEF